MVYNIYVLFCCFLVYCWYDLDFAVVYCWLVSFWYLVFSMLLRIFGFGYFAFLVLSGFGGFGISGLVYLLFVVCVACCGYCFGGFIVCVGWMFPVCLFGRVCSVFVALSVCFAGCFAFVFLVYFVGGLYSVCCFVLVFCVGW